MTSMQQTALEALIGRELTQSEINQIDNWLLTRRDDLIADLLSTGRTKMVPTEIGAGTILAVLGGVGLSGGAFLDTLVAVGETNRDVYWTMDLIKQGRLRIDMQATRLGLQGLAVAIPTLASAVTALLTLGIVADPIAPRQVSEALNLLGA